MGHSLAWFTLLAPLAVSAQAVRIRARLATFSLQRIGRLFDCQRPWVATPAAASGEPLRHQTPHPCAGHVPRTPCIEQTACHMSRTRKCNQTKHLTVSHSPTPSTYYTLPHVDITHSLILKDLALVDITHPCSPYTHPLCSPLNTYTPTPDRTQTNGEQESHMVAGGGLTRAMATS